MSHARHSRPDSSLNSRSAMHRQGAGSVPRMRACSDEQRARAYEIASRCTIRQTIRDGRGAVRDAPCSEHSEEARMTTAIGASTPFEARDATRFGGLARLSAVPAHDRAEIEVRAPFTGELLGRIPRGTESDVESAVQRARSAQPRWAALSIAERAAVFTRFQALVLERREEIVDLIQLESGKARRHAFEEILDTAVVARHYAVHARRYLRPKRRAGAFPL